MSVTISVPHDDLTPAVCCPVCRGVFPGLRRCMRCLEVSYCSVECQQKDWRAHKRTCVAPNESRVPLCLQSTVDALTEGRFVEVYDAGYKGSGLRTRCAIPKGRVVLLGFGRHMPNITGVNNIHEFVHSFDTVVGSADVQGVAPYVNGFRLNDSASEETMALLAAGKFLDFTREYLSGPTGNLVPNVLGRGAVCFVAAEDIAPGTPLETLYGPGHWVGIAAAGLISGIPFTVAWAANEFLKSGSSEANKIIAARVAPALSDMSRAEHDEIISGLSFRPAVPVWAKMEGVLNLYMGVYGETYHPFVPNPDLVDRQIHATAPWVSKRQLANYDLKSLDINGVFRMARALRPLLVDASDEQRSEAVAAVAATIAAIPNCPRDVALFVASDALNSKADALDGKAVAIPRLEVVHLFDPPEPAMTFAGARQALA